MPSIKDTVGSYSDEEEEESIEYSHSDGVKVNEPRDGSLLQGKSKYDIMKGGAAGFTAATLGLGGYGAMEAVSGGGEQMLEEFQQYIREAASDPQNIQTASEATHWAQEVISSLG